MFRALVVAATIFTTQGVSHAQPTAYRVFTGHDPASVALALESAELSMRLSDSVKAAVAVFPDAFEGMGEVKRELALAKAAGVRIVACPETEAPTGSGPAGLPWASKETTGPFWGQIKRACPKIEEPAKNKN